MDALIGVDILIDVADIAIGLDTIGKGMLVPTEADVAVLADMVDLPIIIMVMVVVAILTEIKLFSPT